MSVIETQGFKLDNSGKRVVVDPITRIEGHLRIEVNLDKDNVIRNAVSTGTMWRGLEVILKGRDPRDAWAFVERICGVCTGVHALASVRCVEDALKIKIPDNANIIRNLMHATLYAHDHLVHFYHLHALDWVDVVSALKADPKRTSELARTNKRLIIDGRGQVLGMHVIEQRPAGDVLRRIAEHPPEGRIDAAEAAVHAGDAGAEPHHAGRWHLPAVDRRHARDDGGLVQRRSAGDAVLRGYQHPHHGGCAAGHRAPDGIAPSDAPLRRIHEEGQAQGAVLKAHWPFDIDHFAWIIKEESFSVESILNVK